MEYTFRVCKEETAFVVAGAYDILKGMMYIRYGMDWPVVDRDKPRAS
jgi:hypothetical protein